MMNPAKPHILAINGDSSSIKFAISEADGPLLQCTHGSITGSNYLGLSLTNNKMQQVNA